MLLRKLDRIAEESNITCIRIRNLVLCKNRRRVPHYQARSARRTFLASGFTDAGVGRWQNRCFCIRRLRRRRRGRKLEESRWRRWRCVREPAVWGKRQAESGTGDDERARECEAARWQGYVTRGAAACAHRRALHSACTSERCGWDARVC